MADQRAWLIDASIYIFRAYYSLPDRWHSPQGYSLNAVYGYASFLLDFIARTGGGRHCAAAFDESLGSCFRNDIFPDYKASRALPDEDLAFQLNCCREITELLGIPSYGGDRYEADDYLATLASLYRQQCTAVTVVTRDKDLGQILSSRQDRWWDFAADKELCADGFQQRFGVRPDQFADYLGLVGDSIDDIPGVPGVGPKTAATLLQHFENLEQLGEQLHCIADLKLRGAAKLQGRLEQHWDQLLLSRQLAVLATEIPGLEDVEDFTLLPGNVAEFAGYLERLGLKGPLLGRCQRLQQTLEAA